MANSPKRCVMQYIKEFKRIFGVMAQWYRPLRWIHNA